jgi:phosphoglycerate dehydrogenase-like enzyme
VHIEELANLILQDKHLRRLEHSFPDYSFIRCKTKKQFLEALPRAEIACSFGFKEEWFPRAPLLRHLISPSAGHEWFPKKVPPGVRVEFSTFHGEVMSQTVLAMMLSHARGLLRAYSLQRKEPWPDQILEPSLKLLKGSQVVILGFGHIGSRIGRLVKYFGARITGLKRNPEVTPDFFGKADRLLPAECLDEVLPETDHLVLCMPATKETTGILNAQRLALLPANAGIYNVGRGNALEEDALVDLLKARPLCEAYLDVFQEEPLSADSSLRSLPNCLILPHVSANAPESLDLFIDELIEKLAAG